jgi:plasmid stabilization system protein ParE
MIELDSIVVMLLIEALGGLLLLAVSFYIFFRNKNAGEAVAANELIDKLEDTEKIKVKKLGAMISDSCDIGEEELKMVLTEILQGERVLYQNIIQMFLNKDITLLREIDQYIDNLSEPYCKILRQSASVVNTVEDAERLEAAESRTKQLMQENKKLAEQLTMSMSTMDEISGEYTRVFSGTQTELELENSRQTMMKIFRNTHKKVKNMANNLKMDEI